MTNPTSFIIKKSIEKTCKTIFPSKMTDENHQWRKLHFHAGNRRVYFIKYYGSNSHEVSQAIINLLHQNITFVYLIGFYRWLDLALTFQRDTENSQLLTVQKCCALFIASANMSYSWDKTLIIKLIMNSIYWITTFSLDTWPNQL